MLICSFFSFWLSLKTIKNLIENRPLTSAVNHNIIIRKNSQGGKHAIFKRII